MSLALVHRVFSSNSKLSLNRLGGAVLQKYEFNTASHPLLIKTTPFLAAEPMKGKKKDTGDIIQKMQKKKKKLQASLQKALDNERRLKPVMDIEGATEIRKTLKQRFRKKGAKLTFDEQLAEEKRRTKFLEQWGSYHIECIQKERRAISNAMASQSRALEALREESEELYQMAIQPDPAFLPFKRSGPVHTPSNSEYKCPLGRTRDVSDKFDRTYIQSFDPEAAKRAKNKNRFATKKAGQIMDS